MDLNWCPCGRRCPEGCMYCSDNCYMKELASNDRKSKKNGKKFEKDSLYYYPYSEKIKVPEYKNVYGEHVSMASNDLVFKNRREYYRPAMNNYYASNHHHNSKDMASSYDSNSSTIEDYFRKQTLSSTMKSHSKQKIKIVTSKENESTKEKGEVKSYDSRSSYVIEAVYPVQNFTSTITVY